MTPEVIIDGTWLKSVMTYGELEWVDVFAGGTESIEFSVARGHSLFRPGALVELDLGGIRRAVGSMIDPSGDRITAEGLHRKGEDEPALNGVSDASLSPNEVTVVAVGRGLPWVHDVYLGDDPVNLDPDQPHSVAEILDARAQLDGGAWWINPYRSVRIDSWPTVPSLHMLPGVDGLAISRDGYASTLHARYLDSATGLYKTVSRTDAAAEKRWGRVPHTITTLLGEGAPMTEATAITLVDGLLLQGASQIGWATPLEVQYGDVVDGYQQPVDLASINRQMIRLHGLDRNFADLQGQTIYDMPIARVQHRADGSAVIEPRKLSTPLNDALAAVDLS